MSRKQYMESVGATCNNWRNTWSYVNHDKKFVVFGLFDTHEEQGLIFSESWRITDAGRRAGAYSQSREHIRLMEDEGYALKTMPLVYSDENKDKFGKGPAKIKFFKRELHNSQLFKNSGDWFATSTELFNPQGNQRISKQTNYVEGAISTQLVNQYERCPKARQACLSHHGHSCAICNFNFESVYGKIGHNFIHVHHLIPLSQIKKEYQVDPIKDLIPLCPNCHSMIHRGKTMLSLEEVQASMKPVTQT